MLSRNYAQNAPSHGGESYGDARSVHFDSSLSALLIADGCIDEDAVSFSKSRNIHVVSKVNGERDQNDYSALLA